MKEKGKEEAEAACREISQKSEEEVKAVEERAVSSCDLQRRKALLTAKQEIIKEVLDSAYQTLLDADDETYFALLRKMLHKFVLAQEGEICFSDTDLKRLPQGFEEEIQAIAREKGGVLTTFKRKAERYAADLFLYMEELKKTCTFEAMFSSKRDELSDKVHRFIIFRSITAKRRNGLV